MQPKECIPEAVEWGEQIQVGGGVEKSEWVSDLTGVVLANASLVHKKENTLH